MRLLKNSVAALCVSVSFSSYALASQGFYFSLSGISSRQEHKTSDYKIAYIIPNTTFTVSGNTTTFAIESDTEPTLSTNDTAKADLFWKLSIEEKELLGIKFFKNMNGQDIIDIKTLLLNGFSDIFPTATAALQNNNIEGYYNFFTTNDSFSKLLLLDTGIGFKSTGVPYVENSQNFKDFCNRIDTAIANDPNIHSNTGVLIKVLQYIEHKFDASNSVVAKVRQSGSHYNVTINNIDNNRLFYTSDLSIKDGNNTLATISRNSSTGAITGTYSDGYVSSMNDAASSYADSQINTSQQMQDFLRAIAGQSTKGAEVNLGYKFRQYNAMLFFAPQLDLTYFNAKKTQTLYTNTTGTTAYTLLQTATNTTAFTNDTLNMQYAGSVSARLGWDMRFFRAPFSVYGLIGGVMTQQSYKDTKINNFGLKYGFGGEIFLSRNLALFGEYYKISTPSKAVQSTSLVTDYQITATEEFKVKSNTDVIRAGLTYYFN